ncbi:MAG: hypothetical protein JXR95_15630 [Deltaproteobacteria bacterium]|nr:hypothetical protein [Deltaproteobacteria bacterium]
MKKKEDISLFKNLSEGIIEVSSECSEELMKAVSFFNNGNFKKVREISTRIVSDSEFSEYDQKAAKELLSRTGIDPVLLYISLFGILFFIFIGIWSWVQSH